MATYSSNTTIKIGSNINLRSTSGSDFSYTVPANSYLVVSYINVASSSGSFLRINYPTTVQNEVINSTNEFIYEPNRTFGQGTIFSTNTAGFDYIELNGYLMINSP